MRRSACLLTILGIGFNAAAAQDTFGPSTAKPRPSGTSMQYFSAAGKSGETPSEQSEQLRVAQGGERTASTPAAQRPQSETSTLLPNYYDQLFGDAAQDFEPQPRLKLTASSESRQPLPELSGLIQADYESIGSNSEGQIQQVRAQQRIARPFPGGAPAPAGLGDPFDQSESSPFDSLTVSPDGAIETRSSFGPRAESQTRQNRTAPTASASETSEKPSAPQVAVTAGPQIPSVSLDWRQPQALNVAQECLCELVVRNPGKSPVRDVEVDASFPVNVRLLSSDPVPIESTSKLVWKFASLAPGAEEVIQFRMIPLERGNIQTQANVRFTGASSQTFTVAEPLLAVTMKGPEQVMVGDSAPQTIIVTNPGNGIATNVQIQAIIPDGLEHARGKRLLMEIGSLNPGESRNVRLAMAAVTGGRHQVQVQANADAGLVQKAIGEVAVIEPSLTTVMEGPGLRYLERQGVFKITVANDGAAATSNVQVMHKIPDGFEFVSADRGVQYDKTSRLMTWFVGRLDRAEQHEIQVTLLAKKTGEHKHLVRATSEHGSISDAEFLTRVEGASSLSISVVDLDDPVELGTEAIYEVRVKNEGTAAARDVGLMCELAPQMVFVGAHGPSPHRVDQGQVVFKTIPEIPAGETIVFRVRVQSQKPGSARFRARVSSESVSEPLTVDELTKFYGD